MNEVQKNLYSGERVKVGIFEEKCVTSRSDFKQNRKCFKLYLINQK